VTHFFTHHIDECHLRQIHHESQGNIFSQWKLAGVETELKPAGRLQLRQGQPGCQSKVRALLLTHCNGKGIEASVRGPVSKVDTVDCPQHQEGREPPSGKSVLDGRQRTHTQSSVTNVWDPRQQTDVRFCECRSHRREVRPRCGHPTPHLSILLSIVYIIISRMLVQPFPEEVGSSMIEIRASPLTGNEAMDRR
jgi:hypothetical protein